MRSAAHAALLPQPLPSRWSRFKDALVLPGMLGFSSWCGAPDGSPSSEEDPTMVPGCMLGKRVVVTGGTAGIGLAVVEQLVRLGASVILVARNEEKAARVRDEIMMRAVAPLADAPNQAATPPPCGTISIELADMSLTADAWRLGRRLHNVHVLVNNCGLLVPKTEGKQFTSEGIELTLATNLLSHFILTNTVGFAPSTPPLGGEGAIDRPRVINVSSGGMYSTRVKPLDLSYDHPEPFDGVDAYARTKRAQVVLTGIWAARLFASTGAVVHAMHPGWVDTPGVQQSLPGFFKWTSRLSMLRTPAQGADTITWLAASRLGPKGPLYTTNGFWLDRAPHVKHMQSGTMETAEDRCTLYNALAALAETTIANATGDTDVHFERVTVEDCLLA